LGIVAPFVVAGEDGDVAEGVVDPVVPGLVAGGEFGPPVAGVAPVGDVSPLVCASAAPAASAIPTRAGAARRNAFAKK
jgi:hypothetical protein